MSGATPEQVVLCYIRKQTKTITEKHICSKFGEQLIVGCPLQWIHLHHNEYTSGTLLKMKDKEANKENTNITTCENGRGWNLKKKEKKTNAQTSKTKQTEGILRVGEKVFFMDEPPVGY